MYLAIDIGGTKTLVSIFNKNGKNLGQSKFPTPSDYDQFLQILEQTVATLSTIELSVAAVAVPGLLDRKTGTVLHVGNLPWHNRPIRDDISGILKNSPVIIENDSRCGGLAEATLLKGQYKQVLYLTISTGIGGALLDDGNIVTSLQDTEMGKMPLQFEGKLTHWENFASGGAIVKRYGRLASQIDDTQTWTEIGEHIAYGVGILCSVMQPEAVIFGGGAGTFADKFKPTIAEYLDRELHNIVRRPKALLPAKYKENSSIYGCFELASRYELSHTKN